MKMTDVDFEALGVQCFRECGGILTKTARGEFLIRGRDDPGFVQARILPTATLASFDRLLAYLSHRPYFSHVLH
jgi:hypothetical protein